MKTPKKTATQAKTPRYEVSVPEAPIFSTNNKELAQEQAEKFKKQFANAIHFVDHKMKEHWYYERTNEQKNFRAFQLTYEFPKVAVEAPIEVPETES
jgi:hypothetical protein